MRTIGMVGGLSWYSTLEYYRVVNEEVQRRLGGHSSASVALQSVDFAEVRACQVNGDWTGAGRILGDAAGRCEAAGADLVLICSNLMHKVYDDVAAAVDVPVVHIADAVAAEAQRLGVRQVGLLGTRWVMEETFYSDRLARHGVGVTVPDEQERELVDRVIFDELTRGRVEDASRRQYVDVIDGLAANGAEAVVLACTEIELLVGASDSSLPLVDSMRLHATRAVDLALDSTVTTAAPRH
jgi:aspartate racemase